jgi:hypothetical protein
MSYFIDSSGNKIPYMDDGTIPVDTKVEQVIYLVEDGIFMDGLYYEYQNAFYASSLEIAKDYVEKEIKMWMNLHNKEEWEEKEKDETYEMDLIEQPQWSENKYGTHIITLDFFEKKWVVRPIILDKELGDQI